MSKVKVEEDVIFTVRFRGEATVVDGKGQAVKTYDVSVQMTEKQARTPLSAFKNAIAPLVLPQVLPGYKKVRTYNVVSAERSDGEGISNLYLMNREDMIEYINLAKYPIQTNLYTDAGQLRQAILLYKENPEAYEQLEIKMLTNRGPSIESLIAAEALNASFVNHDTDGAKPVTIERKTNVRSKISVPDEEIKVGGKKAASKNGKQEKVELPDSDEPVAVKKGGRPKKSAADNI